MRYDSDASTVSGTLCTFNSAVELSLCGADEVVFHISAGSLIATIIAEYSVDGGTTWGPAYIHDAITGATIASLVFASVNFAKTHRIIAPAGSTNVRIRVPAHTSGAATICLSRVRCCEKDQKSKSKITHMHDVYESLVGKEVVVYTNSTSAAVGTLAEYTGSLLKIVDGDRRAYVPVDKVNFIWINE